MCYITYHGDHTGKDFIISFENKREAHIFLLCLKVMTCKCHWTYSNFKIREKYPNGNNKYFGPSFSEKEVYRYAKSYCGDL